MTDGFGQGWQLPVHIRDADVIQINHGDGSDATPREGLYGPASHSSHADDTDMGGLEPRHGIPAIEPIKTIEPWVVSCRPDYHFGAFAVAASNC